MAPFTHHIFVCCNQRSPGHARGSCDPDGGERLRSALKAEVKRRGLNTHVRANKAGCLDQCELGPVVVIYPQGIWYGNVQPEDAERIVDALEKQAVVEDLRLADEQLNTKGKGPSRPATPSANPPADGEPQS